ncbi:MAG TPA: hypothetical protein VNH82_09250, partial [Candidatus Dormibacteraeota bacterium]|nr:hypothetical protein [Candidatus Dormibacteraeota bacterium]
MIWLNPVALVLLVASSGYIFARRLGPLWRSLQAAQPEHRRDHLGDRLWGVVIFVLGQRRL